MDVRRTFSSHRDDVDVEISSVTQYLFHDAVRRSPEWTWPTRAQDDLSSALTASEGHEGRRGIVIDDLLELAFELFDELTRFGRVRGNVTDLVGLHDVHGEELGASP
jgi:hypothetical protein